MIYIWDVYGALNIFVRYLLLYLTLVIKLVDEQSVFDTIQEIFEIVQRVYQWSKKNKVWKVYRPYE